MGIRSFESAIKALGLRVGEFRERAAQPEERSEVASEALEELSNALEELRVTSEELKQQNEELHVAHLERERERRKYRDLFQSAPDGYVVTDLTGRVSEVNDEAQRLLGVKAATLTGKPLSIRVMPADLSRFLDMLRDKAPIVQVAEMRLRRRGALPFVATITRTVISDSDGAVLGHRWAIHDLTSVTQNEERLRQSEALFRGLVDGAKDFAIVRLDVRGRVASWNVGAERTFGYEADEVLGRSFDILRAAEDHSTSEARLLAMAERYGRSEVEGWRAHKNGKRMWTNSVITPLRDGRGRLTGYVRILRDVSERRRTDEALAERSRLSTLQAHVATSLTQGGDLGGLLQRCCEGILVNLGAALVQIWTLDDEGRTLRVQGSAGARDRLPSSVPARGDSLAARMARNAPVAGPDGNPAILDPPTRVWWKRRGITSHAGHPLMLDQRLVGVLEVYSSRALDDLSRQTLEILSRSIALSIVRYKAEERLESALRRLEHTMETMPDAVFTLDAQGHLVQWNQKLEMVTGLTREQLRGRAIRDLVPKSEISTVDEKIASAWDGGGVEWEGHLRRSDGSLAPISWSLAGVQDGPKGVRGVTGAGRDITERREGEMRLAQLSRRLLHLREEEQRRISRELHDSTAQNLAALCMSLTALEKAKPMLDKSTQATLEETSELANRCLKEVRTISYLLHPPLLDEVGVPAALRWYTKGFSKRSGIKTRVRLPKVLGRLEPELETSIFRIVQESLTNVHRHAGAGNATVALRKKKASIVIEIADDGHGITALRGARPASSGSKGAGSTDGRPPGRGGFENEWMGLGLMGVRERVQERKGRLEITTGIKGTTLRVELPLTGGTAP